MYTEYNFKSKKALKEAVAQNSRVTIYQPGPFPNNQSSPDYTGWAHVEGPHYPAAHRWYAKVYLENGKVVRVS